ncbi:MAG TPA: caspase family protein, partial [Rugosimonospora sp.]|nr:caspase family protein [Rugosimonospora sp.]
MAETSSFRLRITPAQADVDPAEVEELAIQLRQDLLASGVPGVARSAQGPAPGGTRAVELIAAGVGFLVTGLSTAASVAQIADYVQRWREAHPRRRRVEVSVIAGTAAGHVVARGVAGRRSALLVANAGYHDPGLSRLRSPVSDVRALADVLGDASIGGFDVDTLTDVSEAVLRRRVAAFFADRQPDDVLLLHFSCHGLKDQRGRLYLAATDTELGSLAATGLPASFVSGQMSESASRSVLLVLDCCYSGAFARDAPVRADRTVHLDEFRDGGTGRTVLTASSATEYSFEGGQLTSYDAEPSVFTEALVRGLRTGRADLDHDGEITVDELFEYASQRVREAHVGQVPRKWSFETTGALVVARSVRPALLPEQIRSDLASDRRVLKLEAVRALAELLAGSREGYRRAASEALIALRDNDDSVQVRSAAGAVLGEATEPAVEPGS